MKKILPILLSVLLLAASIGTLTASADAYAVGISDLIGITSENNTASGAPVVYSGFSVPVDNGVICTLSFAITVTGTTPVRTYHAFVNGQADDGVLKFNYSPATDFATAFLSLTEGHYDEVLLKGTSDDGAEYDIVRFTDFTVTAPVHSIDDSDIPVEYTPVWELTATDLANAISTNRCTVSYNEAGYVTYACTEKGDPYGNYISAAKTKVGRFLLVKYNNHTAVPRMQVYIAQDAGITSDVNMIEFDIASNRSGWTYVIVDLAENAFYDAATQAISYLRFDILEARNVNGGAYKFTGDEQIDVAYIKGFTTLTGLTGWLSENELHAVEKTATLDASQVKAADGGFTFTDEKGETHAVKDNGDGTYGYTFTAMDVHTPIVAKPVLIFDGSRLCGDGQNSMSADFDLSKGYTTMTAEAPDPYVMLTSMPIGAARWLAVRYRTDRADDQADFFMSSANPVPVGGDSLRFDVIGDGQWHTKIIDLASCGIATLDTDTFDLNYLRFDFFVHAEDESAVMDVDYVAFFDNEEAALQFNHELKIYAVTFVANNQIVAKIEFEAGAAYVKAPPVPEKEGYIGKWADYTMKDANFTVKAVYTEIEPPTEAPTDAPTEAPTEPLTEAPTEAPTAAASSTEAEQPTEAPTEPATEPQKSGCKSAAAGLAVLLVTAAAAVALRRKH